LYYSPTESMENIKGLLENRHFLVKTSTRKTNERFEMAREFGQYTGLSTIFVLKLFKQYGMGQVLGIRSWLADLPPNPKYIGKPKAGLVIWKLKQGKVKDVLY
jgi:hypothetical protein